MLLAMHAMVPPNPGSELEVDGVSEITVGDARARKARSRVNKFVHTRLGRGETAASVLLAQGGAAAYCC
jgi:hypothetical protein